MVAPQENQFRPKKNPAAKKKQQGCQKKLKDN